MHICNLFLVCFRVSTADSDIGSMVLVGYIANTVCVAIQHIGCAGCNRWDSRAATQSVVGLWCMVRRCHRQCRPHHDLVWPGAMGLDDSRVGMVHICMHSF